MSETSSNTVVITPYTSNNFDRASFTGNVKRSSKKKSSSEMPRMRYPMSRTRKTMSLLLSCVVFLVVLCACLVASLVLVGRHLMAAAIVSGQNGGVKLVEVAKIVEKGGDTEKLLFRLPIDTKPIHYDITLMPDLQSASFKGKIKMTVQLSNERADILLHSYKLLIDKITVEEIESNEIVTVEELTSWNEFNFKPEHFANDSTESTTEFPMEKDRNITVTGFELLEKSQMVRINLKNKLTRGLYDVTIEYKGDMKNKLVGLHYIEYKAKINGTTGTEKRSIATTKFEPTYARQAYPCFDEPNLKATYTVHLLKPKGDGFIALSNMPQKSEEDLGDEGTLVSFETSKKMSTYLACFIVSSMESSVTTFGPDAKELRVYATPGQKLKTEYALNIGKTIMEYYLTYFKIEYPLPKLDMIAIPDFVSGAMENWGLVTYRETALLYDPETSSEANRARIAEVVAHELAHSWFGNLVTMDWWDDLWLNEGFASYIEYKGVHAAHSDWQMMDQFLIADLHDVLVLDATTASHPIVQSADTPDQITAMFDTISYKKGASILRMLEDAITAEKFQEGVTSYLNNHLYGNAVTADFWAEMDKASEDGVDIPAIMATWTTQMGYPVINVTKSGTKYTLKQERYLTNSETGDKKADYKWTIPITYTSTASPRERKLQWFNKDQAQIEIDIPDAPWVKFNYHQTGYYRINYAAEEWTKFADALINNHLQFDVSDRANLLEESFRLAESGHVSYTVPLELSKYLVKEEDFIVWTVADRVLSQLKRYLFNFASNDNYQKYVANLVKNIAEKLDWNEEVEEKDLKKRLRSVTLSLSCYMGNVDCLEQASDEFSKWLQSDVKLPQNIRGIIYNYGIQRATKKEWQQVLEKYKTETDANEKIRLMEGLSKVKDPELLQSLILFAQDRENIRDQDYFNCMSLISANPSGTALVWNYVRSYWSQIVERFGLNERNLGRLIPQITKTFATQIALDEMKTFFKNNANAGAGVAARLEAEETVKNNIYWVDNYEKTVSDWLAKIP